MVERRPDATYVGRSNRPGSIMHPEIRIAKARSRAKCCVCKCQVRKGERHIYYTHGNIRIQGKFTATWYRKAHLTCWLSVATVPIRYKDLREAEKLKFLREV